MSKTVLHKADTRGYANHGWLEARHSFSFASYYNPERMNFGVLRVLNDDRIDGGMGFGRHPHDNMEIITIPLEGDLEHKDSMGNTGIIRHGDIQVMSAGTGIQHSEYNANAELPTKLLQIWLFPNKQNVTPRYDQRKMNLSVKNQLHQILSPNENDDNVWIHQDAWFHLGKFDQDVETNYTLNKSGNGVYAFVIKGDFMINDQLLNARDALGVRDTITLNIKSLHHDAELLLLEVPMDLN